MIDLIMDSSLTLLKGICLLLMFTRTLAIKRYYATDNCGHVLGPSHLSVIEYDRYVDYDDKRPSKDQNLLPPPQLRNTIWRCVIVVRGMPSSAKSKRYIGIEWRNFHIRDVDLDSVKDSVEECGKAYVTIYRGKNVQSPVEATVCGKDSTKALYEWDGDYVTFLFYADFRRNTSWVPPTTPAKTTAEPICSNDKSTSLPPCTTTRGPRRTTTPQDLYPAYPEVSFRVDVTSFDYDCTKTVDGQVLRCNDSHRCLHNELKCDYYFSHNCKTPNFPNDKTDQSRSYPSYCFTIKTTTPKPTTTLPVPTVPYNWAPVIVGIIVGPLALGLLLWCFWRPGYIPWRLSRLRNVPFFTSQRCQVCRGRAVCCPCLKNCTAVEHEYDSSIVTSAPRAFFAVDNGRFVGNGQLANEKAGNGHVANGNGGNYNGYGMDPSNFASDWLKLITTDGAHLREQR